ncbi:FAD binding domain-containing protein [Cadophora sp. DSE1049]|nr:FAD binding domain-containing protein [Cadophora sp. DSE1049]
MRFFKHLPYSLTLLSIVSSTVAGQLDDVSAQIPLASHDKTTDSDCHNVCLALVASLGDAAFYNPSSSLPGFRQTFFTSLQSELIPACIVTPTSAQHVAQAVSIINKHSCIFAVKSGGHSSVPGASNAPGGVTIDLSGIDDTDVSEDLGSVRIGTGNRWAGVYRKLELLNRTVAGGRNSDVGVGGFVLGGGISFMARRYGWAADNVRNFEVVLANGSLTNINQASSPDLFFALRGGGNNFGIVTHFDMDIYPQGQIWGGQSFYFISPVEIAARKASLNINSEPFSFGLWNIKNAVCVSIVEMACKFGYCIDGKKFWQSVEDTIASEQSDQYAQFLGTLTWSSEIDAWVFHTMLAYTKPVTDPPIFQNFTSLKSFKSSNAVRKLTGLYDEVRDMNERGRRHFWATATFKPSAILMDKINDIFISVVEPIRAVKGCRPTVILQPLNIDEIQHSKKRGGNSLGIDVEDVPLIIFSIVFIWDDPNDDEAMKGAANRLLHRSIQLGKEMGLYHRYIYQNYADGDQDVFAGYGEENRERLRGIQKRFDPEGVFWRLQPGYFKV